MAKLTWDEPGQRLYSDGVDRGVLYIGENAGVPWNGLVSVDEKPSGGQPEPYYIDGVKYLNYSGFSQAAFTLSAFYSPEEFDICDGSLEVKSGFIANNQIRQEFGLSYRTRIGNDLQGPDHGYKIHLVYNAIVAPTSKNYSTISDNNSLTPLSWDIETRPVIVEGFAPTAHFEIDTTKMSPGNVRSFERILYGDDLTTARLPTIDEVFGVYAHAYGEAEYGYATYA